MQTVMTYGLNISSNTRRFAVGSNEVNSVLAPCSKSAIACALNGFGMRRPCPYLIARYLTIARDSYSTKGGSNELSFRHGNAPNGFILRNSVLCFDYT